MDRAHEATDKEIERLERKIKKEYKQALSDIKGKADSYLRKFEEEDKKKKAELELGYIFPNEYYAWRQSRITAGKEYEALIKNISDDLVNADKIAANIIGERVPEVYAMNGNYEAYQMCMGAGANISFDLYDRHTVEHLIDNPIFYPNVDIEKDKRWNEQKVRSAITQGILQGEALPKIANRLQQVTDMDDRAAARNARTYCTRAENAGRYERYKEAEEMGLQYKKEWISTHDDRTRDTHKDQSQGGVGGEVVGIDEEFSNKLQYPGDPDGDPSEVYNCRCTMRSVFVGKKSEAQEEFGKLDPDTTFEEWKNDHKNENNNEDIKERFSDYSFKEIFKEMENDSGDYEQQLWRTLTQGNYKISAEEKWKGYINGTLPNEQTELIDKILLEYKGKETNGPDTLTISENEKVKKALDFAASLKATDEDHDWEIYDNMNSESAVNPLLKGKEADWDAGLKLTNKMDEIQDKIGEGHSLIDISEIKDFKIKDLTTTQPYIEREALNDYIKRIGSGEIDVKSDYGVGSVLIVKQDSKCYVYDGNHRVSAAYLLDKKTITANYINLDNDKKIKEALAEISKRKKKNG